jgi:type II secretory pathway component PulM
VTRRIVRLAALAGVLLLGYLLVVRPALDKTEGAFHSSGLDQIGKALETVDTQLRREIRRSLHLAASHGADPQRLIHCIKHATQNTEKIERCTRKF